MMPLDKETADLVLEAVATYSQDSIFITDGEGKVILLNDIAARLIGAPKEALLGTNVQDLEKNGYLNPSVVLLVLRDKKPVSRVIRTPGEKNLLARTTPIFDQNGKIILTITNSNTESNLEVLLSRLDEERQTSRRYRQELEYLRRGGEEEKLVATGAAMGRVLRQITLVAPTESTVLLSGQSGTGKDVVARAIHRQSRRSERAMLSVNCAAIPETLIESELFGYEKGSFTGAGSAGKQGLFQVADGGTLFLDEIGELPPSAQAKLLRVLENGEIRRVGGTRTLKVDVRIICATNRDLWKMVESGRFREDLYYRIHIFPIHLDPLAQRQEDILPLAKDFLAQLNRKYHTEKVIPPAFAKTLLSYPWPGNIRELRNIIERAYLVSPGKELWLDMPLEATQSGQTPPPDPTGVLALKDYVSQAELAYIRQTVAACHGSVAEAAKALGVHRSVLYRKLKEGETAQG